MKDETDDLWVFGYGSLLWNPGFPVAETRVARLHGWRRSFCMSSIHHRGTVERPGLVLALDAAEGAYCDGLGFRVEARYAAQTIDYLRERELISSAYVETRQSILFSACGTEQAEGPDLCHRPATRAVSRRSRPRDTGADHRARHGRAGAE